MIAHYSDFFSVCTVSLDDDIHTHKNKQERKKKPAEYFLNICLLRFPLLFFPGAVKREDVSPSITQCFDSLVLLLLLSLHLLEIQSALLSRVFVLSLGSPPLPK